MLVVLLTAAATVASDATAAPNAQAIYQQRCAPCHRFSGMGDGPSGAALQPPPQPFSKALKGRGRLEREIIIGEGLLSAFRR